MSLPVAGDYETYGSSGSMHNRRWCRQCRRVCKPGPDACLGELPGVSHACCGHGLREPYVVIGGEPNQPCAEIENQVTLRGSLAKGFFNLIKLAQSRPEYPGDSTPRPGGREVTQNKEGHLSIEEKASRVYRSVLKKKPRTAGEIAEKAGFASGRSISGAISYLLTWGDIVQIGHHSGSSRPTYIKA